MTDTPELPPVVASEPTALDLFIASDAAREVRAVLDTINLDFNHPASFHLEAIRMGLKGLNVAPAVEGEDDE